MSSRTIWCKVLYFNAALLFTVGDCISSENCPTPAPEPCHQLHLTALLCTARHFNSLHCTTPQCTGLHCIELHYTCTCPRTLSPTALHVHAIQLVIDCTTLQCATLHYSVRQFTALHCTALQCTKLKGKMKLSLCCSCPLTSCTCSQIVFPRSYLSNYPRYTQNRHIIWTERFGVGIKVISYQVSQLCTKRDHLWDIMVDWEKTQLLSYFPVLIITPDSWLIKANQIMMVMNWVYYIWYLTTFHVMIIFIWKKLMSTVNHRVANMLK